MFRKRPSAPTPTSTAAFLGSLRWLDKTPLLDHIEPYRLRLFEQFFDQRDETGRPAFNLCLTGRGKKNSKTLDLCLAELRAVTEDSPNGSQVYLLANDKGQADDDLTLLKKLIAVNPFLDDVLKVKKSIIERRDGRGFIEVLPAQDAIGTHGKTYRLAGFDEIHGYRTWDILEAMQFDPTRAESQMWICSYASLFDRPGAPLHDLCAIGRAGTDPRMLFSWYSATYTTDAQFADADPEQRANPSMAGWENADYLAQQRLRLPSHQFRRLHLNLGGSPEGAAYQAEVVIDAIERGISVRLPEPSTVYGAFVDMSGGSNDDAVLGIAHKAEDGRVILDRVLNQGARAPFDPRKAVERFAVALKEYKISSVVGDAYAGETFRFDFEKAGISYRVSDRSKSELYEAAEPLLNSYQIVLLDVPILEQQALGLIWKGGRIDHASGEHDDWVNAGLGAVVTVAGGVSYGTLGDTMVAAPAARTALESGAFGHGGAGGLDDAFGGSGSFRPF